MFRIGVKLGAMYRSVLASTASSVLALSSQKSRSVESLELLLRGFFNLETTFGEGLRQTAEFTDTFQCETYNNSSCLKALSQGAEWKRTKIRTDLLPTLESDFVRDHCKIELLEPMIDVASDPRIANLLGVELLKAKAMDQPVSHINSDFARSFSSLVSILSQEPQPRLTEILESLSRWIYIPVARRGDKVLRLHNTFEQLCVTYVLIYSSRSEGYLEAAPIVTSMVESQRAALKQSQKEKKNVFFYSSHDIVLGPLMEKLGIIEFEGLAHERFFNQPARTDDVDAMMNGLKTVNYGTTLSFELWTSANGFNYVRLLIYSKDDGLYSDVEFKTIQLGSICRKRFLSRNPNRNLNRYYQSADDSFDILTDCPFELWVDITSELMIDGKTFDKLCLGLRSTN